MTRPEHPVNAAETYMTTNEVAELLRTSPETVRFWRHTNKGPASFKVGRRVLYPRAAVEAWIDHHQPGAERPRPPRLHEELPDQAVAAARVDATLGERIAQRIEAEMGHEGPRAQRVMRMCAQIAREEGTRP